MFDSSVNSLSILLRIFDLHSKGRFLSGSELNFARIMGCDVLYKILNFLYIKVRVVTN